MGSLASLFHKELLLSPVFTHFLLSEKFFLGLRDKFNLVFLSFFIDKCVSFPSVFNILFSISRKYEFFYTNIHLIFVGYNYFECYR